MLRFFFTVAAVLFAASSAAGLADESSASKMARAISAGPPSVTSHATIEFLADNGKITVLRKGTNGWTCAVGTKGEVGTDPFCADAPAMQWGNDWMMHKPHPTNARPGLMYMLSGGRDWSPSDPWATKGHPFSEPPHWMLMYPFGATASGLPTSPKMTGTWIMWAGTPYAHLMINQKP